MLVRLAALTLALVVPACGGGGGGGGGPPPGPPPVPTVHVSAAADGSPADGDCDQPSLSDDGRYVVFRSAATNLLGPGGDTDGFTDIYLKDMTSGALTRVSTALAPPVDGNSSRPHISGDGRYVAFVSTATNLVGGITLTAGRSNVYLYDRILPSIALISKQNSTTEANDASDFPRVAVNGGAVYVAYESAATNLVAATYTLGTRNVFRTTLGGANALVSVSTTPGTAGSGSSLMPDLSSTGQFVSFVSTAADLVATDVGGFSDAFVRDMTLLTTTLVSVTNAGVQADGTTTESSISGNGAVVAFKSGAANIQPTDPIHMDIFIRRNWSLPGASTAYVSTHNNNVGSGNSCADPDLSVDGRFVIYQSLSDELVDGDTGGFRDIFRRDTVGLITTRVSVNTSGAQGNAGSGTPFIGGRPSITSSGSYVAFESNATNLGGGAAGVKDIFRRGPF